MSDEELIEAVRPDLEALARTLFKAVHRRVFVHDADDLIQIGLAAAVDARRRWRADGGGDLSGWCLRRGRGAILDAARNQRRWRRLNPSVSLTLFAVNEYAPFPELLTNDGAAAEEPDFDGALRSLGAVMDRRERTILADYYGRGMTLKQVGRKHRLTESGAYLALKRAMRSIKMAVEANRLTRVRAAELLGVS